MHSNKWIWVAALALTGCTAIEEVPEDVDDVEDVEDVEPLVELETPCTFSSIVGFGDIDLLEGDVRTPLVVSNEPRATFVATDSVVAFCTIRRELAIYDRATRSTSVFEIDCDQIAHNDAGEIALAFGHRYLGHYASLNHVLANEPLQVFDSFDRDVVDVGSGPLVLTNTQIITAWHSTDSLDVYDLESGAFVRTVILEGFDDWVHGLDVVGDSIYLLDGGLPAPATVLEFDFNTGAALGTVGSLQAGSSASGLICTRAPTTPITRPGNEVFE